MKYALTCRVESNLSLEKQVDGSIGGYLCEYIPDERGFLGKIRIVANVEDPRLFFSTLRPTSTPGGQHEFVVSRDGRLHQDIIRQFQRLESLLSFASMALDRIHWHAPHDEVICETDEERRQANIYSIQFSESYDKIGAALKQNDIEALAKVGDRFDHLIIPMAFWREGQVDFHSFRYVNAFFKFYFVLEGLYGNGKTQNSAIEKEFLTSTEFAAIIENQLKRYAEDSRPVHRERIKRMLDARNKRLDHEGIIHLLIRTRGELHHCTNNPNRPEGTPFNQRSFESIAHLGFVLATEAIGREMANVNRNA